MLVPSCGHGAHICTGMWSQDMNILLENRAGVPGARARNVLPTRLSGDHCELCLVKQLVRCCQPLVAALKLSVGNFLEGKN